MTKETLELVALDIQSERRRRNNQLLDYVEGRAEIYNGEDLARLVGELNAAYNHCVASIAGDGNIYCLLKHISTAIVLAGEVDGDAASLYQIMAVITDEKIQPCAACRLDASGIIEAEITEAGTKKGEEDGTVRNRPIEMAE